MGKNIPSRAEDLGRIEDRDFCSKAKVKLLLCLVEDAASWMSAAVLAIVYETLIDKGYRVSLLIMIRRRLKLQKERHCSNQKLYLQLLK